MKFNALKDRVKGFTPGPWEVFAHDSGHSKYEMNISIVAGDVNDTICDLDGLYRVTLNEKVALDDGTADAGLIAAAPNMFAALEAVHALHRKRLDSVYGYMCEYCSEEYPCETISYIREAL